MLLKINKRKLPMGVFPILFILGGIILIWIILRILPYPQLREFRELPHSLIIMDRNQEPLYTLPLEEGLIRIKTCIGDSGVNKELQSVILSNEDSRFYKHFGIDPFAIFRSFLDNIKEGEIVSGASTISMQLASIIIPRNPTLWGKFLEMLDALKLETRLTKAEIFNLYMTHLPFGHNVEGYEAAAYFYFGKPCSQLSAEEISVLAVIPRNPNFYNPLLYPERVYSVLLRSRRKITEETFNAILLSLQIQADKPQHPIKAPHFVEYIRHSITEEEKIAGLPIVTTLDMEMQNYGEDILNDYIKNSQYNRISNGAMLLIEDHKIRAYIGANNFYDIENSGQIDGIQILRQPGSTLKPFLYELAMENGFTPASILPDIPMSFGSYETYKPSNYNDSFCGPVRMRIALASSLNIPAVYTLEQIGVDPFIEKLKALGFDSLEGQEDKVGIGIAVGNAEVSLYELVRAFDIFRYDGVYSDLFWREDEEADVTVKVMDSKCASLIRNILSDNNARVQGFGRNSVMNTSFPTFFKTGTSNQFNNIWALGGSSDLTCGVWMGNFNGTTIIGQPGSSIPAKIVVSMFEQFSEKQQLPDILPMETEEICALSGEKAGSNCSVIVKEFFPSGNTPDLCSYHQEDGTVILPSEYQEWVDKYSYDLYRVSSPGNPSVISPQDGSIFYLSPMISLDNQGILFSVNGEGHCTIQDNGSELLSKDLPIYEIILLERGRHVINFNFDYHINDNLNPSIQIEVN